MLAVASGRIIRCYNTFLGFPDVSAGKESACNAGDAGSIPESGRTPEEEMATQYSCLENFMDGGACELHSMDHKELDTTEHACISAISSPFESFYLGQFQLQVHSSSAYLSSSVIKFCILLLPGCLERRGVQPLGGCGQHV